MISVETKTFETGVLRLVGLSKINCISMILIQSFMFVLPSIIFGYGASIPCLIYIYQFLMSGVTDVHISIFPTFKATVQAVVLGLFIPMLSSIVPIQSAMSK